MSIKRNNKIMTLPELNQEIHLEITGKYLSLGTIIKSHMRNHKPLLRTLIKYIQEKENLTKSLAIKRVLSILYLEPFGVESIELLYIGMSLLLKEEKQNGKPTSIPSRVDEE